MHRHSVRVRYSEEDKCFVARVPEIDGCMAHGNTPEEAVRELQVALGLAAKVFKAEGRALPEPLLEPKESSGKLVLRMPQWLHSDLARRAEDEGVSLNQHIVTLLTAAHAVRSVEALLAPEQKPVGWRTLAGRVRAKEPPVSASASRRAVKR